MKKTPVLSTLAAGLALMAGGHAAAAERPSVVIVHGAFADGSDWAKVKVTTRPTSHGPQQSRPADVAEVILAAVDPSTK
jgi:hypothetical protein